MLLIAYPKNGNLCRKDFFGKADDLQQICTNCLQFVGISVIIKEIKPVFSRKKGRKKKIS